MKFSCAFAVVAVLASLLHGIGLPFDSGMLTAYEGLFAVLGGGSILFMVAVVAAGDSADGTALPPSFRRLELTAAPKCLVCNAPGRSGWVACTRCDTPHHADCARYLSHCAVYGCDKSAPLLVAAKATRSAKPRSG